MFWTMLWKIMAFTDYSIKHLQNRLFSGQQNTHTVLDKYMFFNAHEYLHMHTLS